MLHNGKSRPAQDHETGKEGNLYDFEKAEGKDPYELFLSGSKSLLTITNDQVIGFAIFDILLIIILAVIYRPLLFSSLDEQVAQAKGVPIALMNVLFMAIMAGVITIAVPAVGTLLIFALVVTPAATANIIAASPLKAMVTASVLCLVSIWGGLVLSAMFPAPPSFIIVTLSTLMWAIARGVSSIHHQR